MFKVLAPRLSGSYGRPLVFGLLALLGLVFLLDVHGHVERRHAYERQVAAVPVTPPPGIPEISQASIDLALVVYGIDVPANAEHPLLDMDLKDRGLTMRGTFMEKARVTIGPAAFTSWGLLGSTLAHEIEVHCHQNFFAIYMMDLVGLNGTDMAERQAYEHELHDAKRFGLDPVDKALIADTMDFYYPAVPNGKGRVSRNIQSWLARNFLREGQSL